MVPVSSGKVSVRLVEVPGLAMVNMPLPEASGASEIFDMPLKHLRLCEVSIRCGQFAIKPASAVSSCGVFTVCKGYIPMGGSHKTICGLAVELYDFPSCHLLAFQSSEFSFNGVEFCFEFFYSRNKKRNGVGVMKD
jgi:hypothetical protein